MSTLHWRSKSKAKANSSRISHWAGLLLLSGLTTAAAESVTPEQLLADTLQSTTAAVRLLPEPINSIGDDLILGIDFPLQLTLPQLLTLDFAPAAASEPELRPDNPQPSTAGVSDTGQPTIAPALPQTLTNIAGACDLSVSQNVVGPPQLNSCLMDRLFELLQEFQLGVASDQARALSNTSEALLGALDRLQLVDSLPRTAGVQARVCVDVSVPGQADYRAIGSGASGSCNGDLVQPGIPLQIPLIPEPATDIRVERFDLNWLRNGSGPQLIAEGLFTTATLTLTITLSTNLEAMNDVTIVRQLPIQMPQLPIPALAVAFGGENFGLREARNGPDWHLTHIMVPPRSPLQNAAQAQRLLIDLLSVNRRVQVAVGRITGANAPPWQPSLATFLPHIVDPPPIPVAGVGFSIGDRRSLPNDLDRNCDDGFCGGVDRPNSDDIGLNDEMFSAIALGISQNLCISSDDDHEGTTVALRPILGVIQAWPNLSNFGPDFIPSGAQNSSGIEGATGDSGVSSYRWITGQRC